MESWLECDIGGVDQLEGSCGLAGEYLRATLRYRNLAPIPGSWCRSVLNNQELKAAIKSNFCEQSAEYFKTQIKIWITVY